MANDKVQQAIEQLNKGVEEIYKSGLYKSYLKTMAKFHNYSARNSLLIYLQNPNATRVAGFNRWKELKRSVSKGAKAIKILAPIIEKEFVTVDKDRNGNPLEQARIQEITLIKGFRIVNVFDIGQTHGKELPTIAKRLNGEVDNFEILFSALKEQAPFPVRFDLMDERSPQCNGYCSYLDKEIVIREGLSQEQTIKTLIHETAHALYHDIKDTDRQRAEIEAESIAFVVCERYGIDSSQYSFGYVAGWSHDQELKVLTNSLDTIQSGANEIIEKTDRVLEKSLTRESLEQRLEESRKQKETHKKALNEKKDLNAEQGKAKEKEPSEFMKLLMENYDREGL